MQKSDLKEINLGIFTVLKHDYNFYYLLNLYYNFTYESMKELKQNFVDYDTLKRYIASIESSVTISFSDYDKTIMKKIKSSNEQDKDNKDCTDAKRIKKDVKKDIIRTLTIMAKLSRMTRHMNCIFADYMKKHTNPENADLLHSRNKGVIEIGLKIQINCPNHLKHLFSWENLDAVSKKIIEKPELVYVYTCKNNYGAIVTNGTAILGLGNIGALAGMPVMEGKSVLFKHFGGTDICPICIQEYDNDKLIAFIQRISPSFAIINLEDIKGPDCFNFTLIKLLAT